MIGNTILCAHISFRDSHTKSSPIPHFCSFTQEKPKYVLVIAIGGQKRLFISVNMIYYFIATYYYFLARDGQC
jgi:hypothetical protein